MNSWGVGGKKKSRARRRGRKEQRGKRKDKKTKW